MNNLLNSNAYLLKKSLSFKICSIIMVSFAIFTVVIDYIESKCINLTSNMEGVFVIYPLIMMIFPSTFITNDYLDKTIKNKIILGSKKQNIYLANLITTLLSGLIFMLIYIITLVIISLPFFKYIELSTFHMETIIPYLLFVISYTSLFTLIPMVVSKGYASSVSFGIFILLSFSSSIERYGKLASFIWNYINPMGVISQIIEYNNPFNTIPINLTKISFYTIITIILINTLGITIFKNKEFN